MSDRSPRWLRSLSFWFWGDRGKILYGVAGKNIIWRLESILLLCIESQYFRKTTNKQQQQHVYINRFYLINTIINTLLNENTHVS